MRIMSLASLSLLALVTFGAQAQAPTPTPEQQAARDAFRKACQSDMQTLCADKQGREAFQCLRDNSDKVSASCKDAMSKLPRRPAPASPPPQ